jgi:hypothetical protein
MRAIRRLIKTADVADKLKIPLLYGEGILLFMMFYKEIKFHKLRQYRTEIVAQMRSQIFRQID